MFFEINVENAIIKQYFVKIVLQCTFHEVSVCGCVRLYFSHVCTFNSKRAGQETPRSFSSLNLMLTRRKTRQKRFSFERSINGRWGRSISSHRWRAILNPFNLSDVCGLLLLFALRDEGRSTVESRSRHK